VRVGRREMRESLAPRVAALICVERLSSARMSKEPSAPRGSLSRRARRKTEWGSEGGRRSRTTRMRSSRVMGPTRAWPTPREVEEDVRGPAEEAREEEEEDGRAEKEEECEEEEEEEEGGGASIMSCPQGQRKTEAGGIRTERQLGQTQRIPVSRGRREVAIVCQRPCPRAPLPPPRDPPDDDDAAAKPPPPPPPPPAAAGPEGATVREDEEPMRERRGSRARVCGNRSRRGERATTPTNTPAWRMLGYLIGCAAAAGRT
jgi:hypothetical protein